MDLITLAMAKAYTDSKTGNGSGFGLPVVELTIPHNLANAELTPEEAQMMWELNGGMCIFKVNYIDGGMTVTGIPHVVATEDGCEYMLEFNGVQYLVDNYVGIWMFKLSFGE